MSATHFPIPVGTTVYLACGTTIQIGTIFDYAGSMTAKVGSGRDAYFASDTSIFRLTRAEAEADAASPANVEQARLWAQARPYGYGQGHNMGD